MTVSLLLVVVLLKVFSAATASWQKGEAQADAFREARGALQLMARDLSTTIQPLVVKLDGTTTSAQPLLPTLVLTRNRSADPPPTSGTEALNEEVYCLTNIINSATPVPAPTKDTPAVQTMASETCAVGYFCQWMPDIATADAVNRAPSAFALMRQFLNSDGVSARLQASNGASTPLLAFPDLFARASLRPGATAPLSPPTASSTQLAAYIWDLKFRIDTTLTASGDGEAGLAGASVDNRPPLDHNLPPQTRIYDGQTQPYPNVLPAYVEIRFKALSTGAARRLEGNKNVKVSDWITAVPGSPGVQNPTAAYRQYILPDMRQFVLRVPLINSNPLPKP